MPTHIHTVDFIQAETRYEGLRQAFKRIVAVMRGPRRVPRDTPINFYVYSIPGTAYYVWRSTVAVGIDPVLVTVLRGNAEFAVSLKRKGGSLFLVTGDATYVVPCTAVGEERLFCAVLDLPYTGSLEKVC